MHSFGVGPVRSEEDMLDPEEMHQVLDMVFLEGGDPHVGAEGLNGVAPELSGYLSVAQREASEKFRHPPRAEFDCGHSELGMPVEDTMPDQCGHGVEDRSLNMEREDLGEGRILVALEPTPLAPVGPIAGVARIRGVVG